MPRVLGACWLGAVPSRWMVFRWHTVDAKLTPRFGELCAAAGLPTRRPRVSATVLLAVLALCLVPSWLHGVRQAFATQPQPDITHWFGTSLRWEAVRRSPCEGRWLRSTPPRCNQAALPSDDPPDDELWKAEIATFDEHNRPLGMRTAWEVHTQGLWHHAVGLLIFDSSGRLLLQRRSPRKWVFPGCWDASVAETSEKDEPPLAAAHRGAYEELGVLLPVDKSMAEGADGSKGDWIHPVTSRAVCWRGRMPLFELADCEIVHFSVFHSRGGKLDSLVESRKVAAAEAKARSRGADRVEDEVDSSRWVTLDELAKEVESSPDHFTPLLLSAYYECGEGCWGAHATPGSNMMETHAPPAEVLVAG